MELAKKDLERYIIKKGKNEINLVRTDRGNNWKVEHTISEKNNEQLF